MVFMEDIKEKELRRSFLQQQQLKLRAELCLIKILKKFKTYLNNILKNINKRINAKIKKEKLSAQAYKVEQTYKLINRNAKSYQKAFEKEAVFVRMGGSIPVVEWLDDLYKHPIVLLGFGTPEARLPSPNES